MTFGLRDLLSPGTFDQAMCSAFRLLLFPIINVHLLRIFRGLLLEVIELSSGLRLIALGFFHLLVSSRHNIFVRRRCLVSSAKYALIFVRIIGPFKCLCFDAILSSRIALCCGF
jgi:hypothetical protein